MRYFTYLAEQSFRTAPSGERLFLLNGPWSRPYIMPDADTERRIYWKLVWQLRIMLGALFLGILPLFFWLRADDPVYFLGAIVAVSLLFMLASKVLFASDLRGLGRAPQRLPVSRFFGELASKHSFRGLLLRLAGCLMFVAIAVWMVASGPSRVIGLFCALFFGICSIGWGYAAWLRRPKAPG